MKFSSNKNSRKPLVSNCIKIDVMAFHRAGAFIDGTIGTISFEKSVFKDCSFMMVGKRLIIENPNNTSKVNTIMVSIKYHKCRFGGHRPYFICPNNHCGKRYTFLYSNGRHYQCRKCLNLAYPSQNETATERGYRKARNIRLALGGSVSLFDPFPIKPKGMWRSTYEQLKSKANYIEDKTFRIIMKRYGKDTNELHGPHT